LVEPCDDDDGDNDDDDDDGGVQDYTVGNESGDPDYVVANTGVNRRNTALPENEQAPEIGGIKFAFICIDLLLCIIGILSVVNG